MLYDARKAGAPMLLTAGQHDQSFTATEPILWADLPPIARPFVKWATDVRRLEDPPRLALPGRPVVSLVGDGSAMYTDQALWMTAARESLAGVYVIMNNASYRILKQRTHALKGFSAEDDIYVGMDLDRPAIDFVDLAKSLGVPGEHVEKTADVGPAVTRGLRSEGPSLIDVRIDSTFK